LARTRRIHPDTQVAFELPWFGRRIDLATLTRSRRTSAYELKLTGLNRALEQASYNRLAFDRSYVVTPSIPRSRNVELAKEHGIGLIVVRDDHVLQFLDSPLDRGEPELRARLLMKLRSVGRVHDV
jgi:hypothetical protein